MTAAGTPTATAPRPVTPLGILAEQLARIAARVDALDGAEADLRDAVHQAHALAAGLEPYLERCTTPASPALRALAERTAATDWGSVAAGSGSLEQEMLSGHVEGQALAFLVRMTRARRVLDLGMFTGYSALAMAEALPDDGEVVACEVDAAVAEVAVRSFGGSADARKIAVRLGPAAVTLAQLADAGEQFDLVFLDADKAGYAAYVDTLLARDLLAPDGLLCVDNTLMQGLPWVTGARRSANGEAIAAFNASLARDPRVEQVLLPLRDGLTLVRRV